MLTCIHCEQAIRPPEPNTDETYYRHIETNQIGCYEWGQEPYAEPSEGAFTDYVAELPISKTKDVKVAVKVITPSKGRKFR